MPSNPSDGCLRPLGASGLYCHPLGFGCYRIAEGQPEHQAALHAYLDRGGNLLDTSANYADGLSEVLVGRVLKNYPRRKVIVVTKGGYIQGQNMDLAKGRSFPEVVKYGEGLWHCIHPEFLDTQIPLSLERMQLDRIDVYLLHNPEYFLNDQAQKGKLETHDVEEFYRRIRQAFAYLETQVQAGTIEWYGISSNNFGLPGSDSTMTSVSRCLEEARRISSAPRFRVVQLPMNVYECGGALEGNNNGKTVLEFCKAQGLGVLVNRPLNASHRHQLLRLVDFAFGRDNPISPKNWPDLLKPLHQVEQELAQELKIPLLDGGSGGLAGLLTQVIPQVDSMEHWESVLDRFVIPPIRHWLGTFRSRFQDNPIWEHWEEEFVGQLSPLFQKLEGYLLSRQQVQSDHVRNRLDAAGFRASSLPLSQKALGLLLNLDGISCVLNGMRRVSYVDDAFQALAVKELKARQILANFHDQHY